MTRLSLVLLASLIACGDDSGVCPDGTTLEGDVCRPGDSGVPGDMDPPEDMDSDMPGACGVACPPARPLCDTESGECAECLTASDCSAGTPVCDGTGTCVQCGVAADCDASAPVCTDGACGACAADTDCALYPDATFCGASGACVECTADAECTGVDAAKCETATGTCMACDSSAQCEGTGANACVAGVCEECTEATAATDCGDNSCNPATNECTTTERASVLDCGRCVGDDECRDPDAPCVPMNYMGTARPDGYCLKLASTGCARPYLIPVTGVSLSGFGDDETTYCGIDQNSTTCDAVRALRESRECAGGDATLCADAGARCEMVGLAPNRCTYPCGSPADCPPIGIGSTCVGSSYCGS